MIDHFKQKTARDTKTRRGKLKPSRGFLGLSKFCWEEKGACDCYIVNWQRMSISSREFASDQSTKSAGPAAEDGQRLSRLLPPLLSVLPDPRFRYRRHWLLKAWSTLVGWCIMVVLQQYRDYLRIVWLRQLRFDTFVWSCSFGVFLQPLLHFFSFYRVFLFCVKDFSDKII